MTRGVTSSSSITKHIASSSHQNKIYSVNESILPLAELSHQR